MSNTKAKSEVKAKEKPQPKPRRSRGDGSLFQNSKGKWVARYQGKEFTGDVKSEVKSKMDKYKILVQTGEAVTSRLTVKQYGEKFLHYKEQQVKRGNFKNSSLDRLERTFHKQIGESGLANVLMRNLERGVIQDFIDDLSERYSLSTIRKAYNFLSALISFGINMKDFPKNFDPLALVELPDESVLEVKTKEIEIMPDEYLPKFKEVAMAKKPDGTLAYRYGPLLVFGLNTGFREGELMALSRDGLSDVDGRHVYHVSETVSTVKNRSKNPDTKTKRIITKPKYPRSVRNVPLNKEAEHCLQLMLDIYETSKIRPDLIVTTKNGMIPTARNIQLTLDRILKKAGLPHYGTHAMRHTFATRLLRQTKSHQELKAVAELLGDDYNVVVQTYLHTEEEGKSILVDLIAG